MICRTSSVEETQKLAAEIAPLVRPGDVVVLAGDLGTGKTAFAQGFGAALGVAEHITSPTFILVRIYEGGRLPLVHADVYRLEHLQEAEDLGLAEVLDAGGVALIEWGDLVAPVLPADFLEVRLERGDGDDDREIRFRCVGAGWAARTAAIRSAIAPWAVGA